MKMTDAQVAKAVRARDGYRCTECGVTAEEHIALTGKTLEVHRLTPGSPYTLDGCVTLCRKCHGPKPRLPRGTFPPRYPPPLSLTPDIYEALAALAERNGRPISWEARLALLKHLRDNGAWPPPPH